MANDFGGSLPVENVQALASKDLNDVPPRYIRPERQSEQVLIDESLQIPVIDMSKLMDEDELMKLHLACKDWGFFQVFYYLLFGNISNPFDIELLNWDNVAQLINHGISEEVMEKMKINIAEFFNLPLEEKMVYAQQPNNIEGYGQAFVLSDEQKLDWGDMFFLIAQPPSLRNTRLWPNIPASLR